MHLFVSFLNLFLSLYWICYHVASVLCFGHRSYRILVPQPGIELLLPALEGKVLTIGPPGKPYLSFYSFRSLNHFELIFVYGVMKRWHLILWHVDIQLKRLFFSHWIVFMPLSANQLIINVRCYFWTLSFVLLISMYTLMPVPHSPEGNWIWTGQS